MKNLGELVSFLLRSTSDTDEISDPEDPAICFACDADLSNNPTYESLRVCLDCGFHYNLPARERIQLLIDNGTFHETNRSLTAAQNPDLSEEPSYSERLAHAREKTGLSEAVITGTGELDGIRTAILALDLGFLGGSMGIVVGEKVSRLFEHAQRKKLPTIAIVSSGGARIQEGILSLMQMAKTTSAAKGFEAKGLPLITVTANPTTGQVFASFANLADIIIAEPGSLVGFAPLRIAQRASEESKDLNESHTAETHLIRGNLDRIVHRDKQKQTLAAFLRLLAPQPKKKSSTEKLVRPNFAFQTTPTEGRRLEIARHPNRPTSEQYIKTIFTYFEPIHGDRISGIDPTLIAGLGYLAGKPVAVIATQRNRQSTMPTSADGRLSPTAIRQAQRIMRLAGKFRLPLISLIDTPGLDQSLHAEEEGLGAAIAETLSLMIGLSTPTIAAIVGEGGSEAALCLGLADRVLMHEFGIFSPVSPESAAGVLYRDSERAEDIASSLKITASDCLNLEIIEEIVPEPADGAHTNHTEAASLLRESLIRNLAEIDGSPIKRLVKARERKFRRIGNNISFIRPDQILRSGLERQVRNIRKKLPQR